LPSNTMGMLCLLTPPRPQQHARAAPERTGAAQLTFSVS
jgi:hypothetical protein